jgi:hypothetical protein
VPEFETFANIISIRFTQLGMPVKSIAVPLVEFTEVPLVNGWDSLAGVIDPSAGVDEKVPVVAAVIIPFALTVRNGISETLP